MVVLAGNNYNLDTTASLGVAEEEVVVVSESELENIIVDDNDMIRDSMTIDSFELLDIVIVVR